MIRRGRDGVILAVQQVAVLVDVKFSLRSASLVTTTWIHRAPAARRPGCDLERLFLDRKSIGIVDNEPHALQIFIRGELDGDFVGL